MKRLLYILQYSSTLIVFLVRIALQRLLRVLWPWFQAAHCSFQHDQPEYQRVSSEDYGIFSRIQILKTLKILEVEDREKERFYISLTHTQTSQNATRKK